ncbi:aldehyde dehydrogenase family protein [Amylibacter sp.]|nr:aldehyde dehydrogenase family protein [Amylibacter sp.]
MSDKSDIQIVDAIIEKASIAQLEFEKNGSQKAYDMAAQAVGWAIMEPSRNKELAELAVLTTGLGNVKDKIIKNHRKTLGLLRDISDVKTFGIIENNEENGIIKIARAIGVIGAVVPSTNPIATPANNIINALKCGNAIVISPSPKGISGFERLLKYIHLEFDKLGINKDLVQMVPAPGTKEKTQQMLEKTDLVVVTGSQNNVRRERAEKNLQVAEASLEQSSKLAALGEMSAAVSHELNQPLAAMRTYLAAAKLLLSRKRSEEALSSFQRIDDLIGRMGTITQQLKSYSRKGSDDLIPVNFINSINTSIAMMAPQLGQQSVEITKSLPEIPVKVLADPVRLEQVIVNLLRNALDAMKGQTERYLQISLTAGEMATLTIQDNGPGIENLDEMFEPFFTTKKPGEGVGLGLAISSSIAKDLDGRLFARNVSPRGAVFEFQLPQIVENNKDLE